MLGDCDGPLWGLPDDPLWEPPAPGPLPQVQHLGVAVRYYRLVRGLSQDDLALCLKAVGVPWERQQVQRFEQAQRDVTAHELYALAVVLAVSLGDLYGMCGYPLQVPQVAPIPGGRPFGPHLPAQVAEQLQPVRHLLSPGARALLDGHTWAHQAVAAVMLAWVRYERASGRPDPSRHAQRRKAAALWAELERDPDGFRARAQEGPAQ